MDARGHERGKGRSQGRGRRQPQPSESDRVSEAGSERGPGGRDGNQVAIVIAPPPTRVSPRVWRTTCLTLARTQSRIMKIYK